MCLSGVPSSGQAQMRLGEIRPGGSYPGPNVRRRLIDGAVTGVDDGRVPSRVVTSPVAPAIPLHLVPPADGDGLGPASWVGRVLTMPLAPANERLRARGIPHAGISLLEPTGPLAIVDIKQAHRDRVQLRRARAGEDLAER